MQKYEKTKHNKIKRIQQLRKIVGFQPRIYNVTALPIAAKEPLLSKSQSAIVMPLPAVLLSMAAVR